MNTEAQKTNVEQLPVNGRIYTALGNILKDCVPIAKDRRNQQQGFQFRGIDDVYNALHSVMAKHQVFTVPRVLDMQREERKTKNGGTLIYTILTVEYDFISGEDGSRVTAGPVMGEAMDTGDKSCNKALAMAHKYIVLQTFLVPTAIDDADATAYDLAFDELTDEQAAQIQDFKEAKQINAATQEWIDKNTPLTEKKAAGLLRRLNEENK